MQDSNEGYEGTTTTVANKKTFRKGREKGVLAFSTAEDVVLLDLDVGYVALFWIKVLALHPPFCMPLYLAIRTLLNGSNNPCIWV
jgi:hypothetical protein